LRNLKKKNIKLGEKAKEYKKMEKIEKKIFILKTSRRSIKENKIIYFKNMKINIITKHFTFLLFFCNDQF
jgi:hypothetical protein